MVLVESSHLLIFNIMELPRTVVFEADTHQAALSARLGMSRSNQGVHTWTPMEPGVVALPLVLGSRYPEIYITKDTSSIYFALLLI